MKRRPPRSTRTNTLLPYTTLFRANCTASGKALLAALPRENFERRVEGLRTLPSLTPNSIATVAKLRRELNAIRARGYALDDEEVLPGVACEIGRAHV